ncbi:MerR family transcriptional regulator [Embleya scabrispora]|uniref:transcriptional regulator FtsR n=1 Tax=Embleya scabrispora TaxID=159449 RepID=UPI00035DA1C7|nr:MerR family transcriptional regulator [Embleya scabrispora]
MSPAAAGSVSLSIGGVLTLLRPEFPDISISKIRFLEAEGLIEPQRSPSGYRKFGAADIERLRYVLRVQRDRYLPLRVIKDQLEAMDRGLEPAGPTPAEAERFQDADGDPGSAGREGTTVLLDRPGLIAAAGIQDVDLARLEEFGLIQPHRPRPGGTDGEHAVLYDGDALVVARLVAALGRYGVEPRHLRQTKAAADREAALVEQIVAPLLHRRGARAKAGAEETVRDLLALTSRLHTVLVTTALAPRLGR